MSALTWLRLLGLAVVLAAVVVIVPAWTQPPAGKKMALLVGVNEYDRSGHFPNLKYAENDVEDLAKILGSPAAGFTVRVLTTRRGEKNAADRPTAVNINKALETLLAGRTPRDTVLIAFSGHGMQLSVPDPAEKGVNRRYSYFCPCDSDLVKKTSYSTGKNESLLNLADLFNLLGESGACTKLVLMDACRNELKPLKDAVTRSSLNARSLNIPEGVGALFSCSSGQYAFESDKLKHGVFFHFVLEGLRGKARDEDDEITWLSLRSYVTNKKVSKEAAALLGGIKQTPHAFDNLPGESPVLIRLGKEVVGRRDKDGAVKEKVVKTWGKEIVNSIGMKLLRIPPGKFKMGSSKKEQDAAIKDFEKMLEKEVDDTILALYRAESPQNVVHITKEFWLGIHEVTQKQFKDVMGYNPSYFSTDGKGKPGLAYDDDSKPAGGKDEVPAAADTSAFPVENVSWQEANEFCKKLTERFGEGGRKYRLPTEAEWEYACRGGADYPQTFHFGDSLSSTQANFNGNYPFGGAKKGGYLEGTCKVGNYEKNGFGLYDMHGNVWEWCGDWFDKDYYRKRPPKDPLGPARGKVLERVFRGGCWLSRGQFCRSAVRFKDSPALRCNLLGFRVAVVRSDK